MATEKFIICDACDLRESAMGPRIWLNITPSVGSHQAMDQLVEGKSSEEVRQMLDAGDFCTLKCLGEWALARGNLRDLERELNEEGGADA